MTVPSDGHCISGLRPARPRRLAVAARGTFRAATAATVLLAVVSAGARTAAAQDGRPEPGPQMRLGLLQHDLDGYGGSENGMDLTIELRGAPLRGAFWDNVYSPRPHIGVNVNDSGDTSVLYTGLSWMADFGEMFYVSADFGGAVHNGKLKTKDPERAQLGSRILFHEAFEVGVRASQRWRVGLRIDHSSNADLASKNDGITNIGILVSREF